RVLQVVVWLGTGVATHATETAHGLAAHAASRVAAAAALLPPTAGDRSRPAGAARIRAPRGLLPLGARPGPRSAPARTGVVARATDGNRVRQKHTQKPGPDRKELHCFSVSRLK